MNENVKKRNGSAKVVICIIIVLILIAIAVGAFALTKFVNFNFTSKAKFIGAFTDVGEKISSNTEDFSKFSTESMKAYNKLEGKPVEYNVELSADINELSIPGLSSTEARTIKGIINENKATLNLKADTNENKFYGNLMLNEDELGEIVYNSDAIALKIPELDKNNMSIFKDTLKGTSYEGLEEIFNFIDEMEFNYTNPEDINFTADEIKHFADIYSKIFENYVTDDMLESEKTDITIDGNSKSCDKVTLKLNGEQLASLLEKYVKAFDEDNEGKEILINKYIKMMKASYMYEMMLDEMGYTESEFKSEMEDGIDDVIEEINDALDAIRNNDEMTYKFIAYSDMFKTYRLEVIAETDEEEAKLTMNIKKDGVYSTIAIDDGSEIMTANFNILKNSIEFNMNFDDSVILDMNMNAKEDNKFEYIIKLNVNSRDVLNITMNSNFEKKSDKEVTGNIDIDLSFEYEAVKISGKLTLAQTTKAVNSIDIPDVTKDNSIDAVKSGLLDQLISQLSGVLGNVSAPSGVTPNNSYNQSSREDEEEFNKLVDELMNSSSDVY